MTRHDGNKLKIAAASEGGSRFTFHRDKEDTHTHTAEHTCVEGNHRISLPLSHLKEMRSHNDITSAVSE